MPDTVQLAFSSSTGGPPELDPELEVELDELELELELERPLDELAPPELVPPLDETVPEEELVEPEELAPPLDEVAPEELVAGEPELLLDDGPGGLPPPEPPLPSTLFPQFVRAIPAVVTINTGMSEVRIWTPGHDGGGQRALLCLTWPRGLFRAVAARDEIRHVRQQIVTVF